jgi:hypothetical protein
MFNGNSSVNFKCSKDLDSVIKESEDYLDILGVTNFSKSGSFTISSQKFSGFGYNSNIEGRITNRDGKYNVSVDFQVKPTVITWLIAICFFPFGLLIFLSPSNAKKEINNKIEQALRDIKSSLDEK